MAKFLSYVRISFRKGTAVCLAFVLSQALMAQVAMAQQEALAVSITPVENGVEFVLTNTSDSSISLLRWETPFEQELTQDLFVITESDRSNLSVHASPAMFSGRLFKRPGPAPADFMEIAAGERVAAVVNLAEYYQLDAEGSHQVSFQGMFYLQGQAQSLAQSLALVRSKDRSALSHRHSHFDGLDPVLVSTDPVTVNLTPVPEVFYARAAGFSSCTAAQQADIALDFDASETITRAARQALQGLPENERQGSPRYQHWFGNYSSERYDTVLDTYTKAETLMGSGEVEFVCGCDQPFFAFVRRTEPFKVNLCTFYWSADRLGTDSRAGTILHEVSHFNEIGGTSDFAYGAQDVSRLADTSPASAVANADSIEYFAENTPFRELSAGVVQVQAVDFSQLNFGVDVNGSVERLGRIYYQVTGADRITLTTLNGDADLAIYADQGLGETICESRNPAGTVDICEIETADTIYIEVRGYMASDYTIVADIDTTVLQGEQTDSGSISTGEWQLYTVTGAGFVQIESLTGDADLYVYSSPAFDVDSLICDSRNMSNSSTIDSCDISGTAYVGVFGARAGQYNLATLSAAPRVADTADAGGTVVTTESFGNSSNSSIIDGSSTSTSSGGSGGGGGPVGPGMLVILFVALGFRSRSRVSLRELAK